jgi:2-polyprenyl-3-methyl-5-hydroxy-6-metoxy-1,4-benzoquinol methylase
MTACANQPEGNYYNKYESRNPVARRLMDNFLRAFDEITSSVDIRTAYEVGCGEGNLSLRLARRGVVVRASDVSARLIQDANERAAREQLPAQFECRSIYDLSTEKERAELAVCCEVLEHLEHTEAAIDVLARIATPYLIVSVPREPLWRILNLARGAYVKNLGNTPGHVQHWSAAAFLRLLKTRFDVIGIRTPLPWTMALCKAPGRAVSKPRSSAGTKG